MNRTKRVPVTPQAVRLALEKLGDEIFRRLETKGFGTFASSHEILGLIVQETHEFEETVHKKDPSVDELFDIAVAAIFGVASITSGTTDW